MRSPDLVRTIPESADTLTSRYLRGQVPRRETGPRPRKAERWLTVKGARLHNLREIEVKIPLHRFVALTGISGSGKSSLMNGCIYDGLTARVAMSYSRAVPSREQPE